MPVADSDGHSSCRVASCTRTATACCELQDEHCVMTVSRTLTSPHFSGSRLSSITRTPSSKQQEADASQA